MPEGRGLIEWEESETASEIETATVRGLFERQVEETPNAPAIEAFHSELSFSELNRRANQLARHLQELGVGPETLVGICLDRSAEMLVGILGILKAGGAYVPLDPVYPEKRLDYILSDSQTTLVLTRGLLVDRLPQSITKVCLDSDWAAIAKQDTANLDSPLQPEHLAYVLYTSGSTGQPKGVAMPHRPLVNLLGWQTTHWSFPEPCRVLQFASLNFDVSFQEIFSTWCSGGAIVLVPESMRKEPAALCRFISEKQIQRIFLPFIALKNLAEAGVAERVVPSCVREVITAGEQLQITPAIVQFFSQMPEATLENQYGPTETHVVTSYRLRGEPAKWPMLPPIGKPIALGKVFVLDDEKRPLPNGEDGELFLGGECLARGYHNRPELTEERFVLDSGGREHLYKTGDLGRILPDGNIQFLGRSDHQVKIRGNRVELGEVEVVLGQHPEVQATVALARECSDGTKQLVAYIVPRRETSLLKALLRSFLQEQLPDYAIPSAFVIVNAFPLTPNGKVDRLTLQEQPFVQPLRDDAEAEGTPVERTLAWIWKEVLNTGHIGLHDNFFETGGDSIQNIRFAAQARQAGIHFSMQQLAENPTIADLAKVCSRMDPVRTQSLKPFELVVQIDRERLPADLEDAYPMTALQAGMLFHSELEPESLLYHEIYTYRIFGRFVPHAMQTAIKRLVERHPVLRTSFETATFSESLQFVHKQAVPILHVEDLRQMKQAAQSDALQRAIEEEKETLFDWSMPPLLRFRVQWLGEKRFDFIVCFHHAILDGWSLATMLREMFQDYLALLKGNSADLPLPGLKFAEFVALEKQTISSESCRAFWQTKLADRPNCFLPAHKMKGGNHGATCIRSATISIPGETKEALVEMSRVAGVSLKTVLHAAHHRVIGLLTGKSEVISGLSVDGRVAEIDAEHTLGLFVNVVPVRIKLDRGSWLDLVRQVARAEQEILPVRRYPLSEIQKSCGGVFFDASFSFLRFQAYKSLSENPDLRLTEGPYFEATNFPFLTTFTVQAVTDELTMQLDCDVEKIDPGLIERAIVCYEKILQEMAFAPATCHQTFCSSLREGSGAVQHFQREQAASETAISRGSASNPIGVRLLNLVHLTASYVVESPFPQILTV